MSFENPHEDLDPTNDLKKKAENPPGRNLDPTDIEKNKTDEKNPEKPKDRENDITKTLALWKENADKYAEKNPDAKPATENPEKAAKVEDDMMREWP